MTYKLITENELQDVMHILASQCLPDDREDALATLRAVMEREGPTYAGQRCSDSAKVYTLPDEDKK